MKLEVRGHSLAERGNFRWVIVVGMASTAAAIVLLTMGAAFDYGACAPHRHMPDFKVLNYFLALGTVLFTFGGLAAFPTIQHDMKRPHEFTKSSFLAFAGKNAWLVSCHP